MFLFLICICLHLCFWAQMQQNAKMKTCKQDAHLKCQKSEPANKMHLVSLSALLFPCPRCFLVRIVVVVVVVVVVGCCCCCCCCCCCGRWLLVAVCCLLFVVCCCFNVVCCLFFCKHCIFQLAFFTSSFRMFLPCESVFRCTRTNCSGEHKGNSGLQTPTGPQAQVSAFGRAPANSSVNKAPACPILCAKQ